MAVIKAVSSKAGIGQALDYVTKEEKTEDKLVSGLHCEPDTVKDEMQATKDIVYVLIRWYVKGCMRSRGYY